MFLLALRFWTTILCASSLFSLQQYVCSETLTFLSSFALSISLAVIMLLLFCCLRTRLPHLYETRATEVENERNLAAVGNYTKRSMIWIVFFGTICTDFIAILFEEITSAMYFKISS